MNDLFVPQVEDDERTMDRADPLQLLLEEPVVLEIEPRRVP
ncbi:hypothetical protein [Jiella pelagia]|uniref:Uncharacterized protein n=1 Tax=Jiella pelagia TaxID=2986949 RepID=A0ABY7BVS4_9HYPH|nr:hypothetical protein [Jiella pelagia]WAP67758.1 hypothetical protein OH818_20130 [Jiella pelagia]